MSFEPLKEYIEEWNAIEGGKPENDEKFISDLMEFMRACDSGHYGFTGNNDYCGHTAILNEVDYRYSFSSNFMSLEFAYGADFVKVFAGNHNGFWVPEYIDLRGDDAAPLLALLKDAFDRWGGFSAEDDE